ncbi:unnamed protein product, partial [marine sediment metagenome]
MPFCDKCGFSYELGENKCPKCGEYLPKFDIEEKNFRSKSESIKQKKSDTIPVASIEKRLIAGAFDIIIGIGLMFFIIRIVIFRFIFRRALVKGLFAVLIVYTLSAIYFLLRDSLKGKSFGKMIFGLTVVNIERNKEADLADSMLRNAILAIIIVPVIGWIIFAICTVIIVIQIGMGKEQ